VFWLDRLRHVVSSAGGVLLFRVFSRGGSARIIHAVSGPSLRGLRADVWFLLLDGAARVRGRAQRADAVLLCAQRARQRGRRRARAVQVPELVAVATTTAEGDGQLHRAQLRDGGGKREAVFLGSRAPLPLLLLVHEAREHVGPPLLPPFGAHVAQHDTAEEDSVEGHDDQDVQVRVPVAFARLGARGALRVHEEPLGGRGGVLQVLHCSSSWGEDLESALEKKIQKYIHKYVDLYMCLPLRTHYARITRALRTRIRLPVKEVRGPSDEKLFYWTPTTIKIGKQMFKTS